MGTGQVSPTVRVGVSVSKHNNRVRERANHVAYLLVAFSSPPSLPCTVKLGDYVHQIFCSRGEDSVEWASGGVGRTLRLDLGNCETGGEEGLKTERFFALYRLWGDETPPLIRASPSLPLLSPPPPPFPSASSSLYPPPRLSSLLPPLSPPPPLPSSSLFSPASTLIYSRTLLALGPSCQIHNDKLRWENTSPRSKASPPAFPPGLPISS